MLTLKPSDHFSNLSSHSESLRLNYELDQVRSENRHLRSKIKTTAEIFQKELKQREDIIFSMSAMVRDREEQFKKILQNQEIEKNLILGKKEAELDALKKSFEDLQGQLKTFESFDLLKRQEKEIENLRKILKSTEKENKSLLKRLKDCDGQVFKDKWKENEKEWKDTCFEVAVLVDSISRFRNVIAKVTKEDSSIELILKCLPSDRDDITKDNLLNVIRENIAIVKGLQDLLLDIYAGKCGSFCTVQ
jgi:hypothetical protein